MEIDIDLDAFGADLAEHGPAGREHLLARLAREALAAGAPVGAATALGDRSEPEVVRARAFAIVARHLQSRSPGAATTPAVPTTGLTTDAIRLEQPTGAERPDRPRPTAA